MIRFPQRGPGLVVYLTCGDPDIATTKKIALAALEAGADVLELGIPFSDPVADGKVIQRASERALAQGTTLERVIGLGAELRQARPQAGLIVFSYYNPVLAFGLKKFAIAAKSAGLDGALITDLTVEEAGDYLACMRAHDLATVFLAAPTSTDARLRRIARASRGFVYALSRTGVTGVQAHIAEDAFALVKRLRRCTKLPIAVGFGISTPAQFRAAGEFADAAVVGSAIVQIIERSAPGAASAAVAEFIVSFKSSAGSKAERKTAQA